MRQKFPSRRRVATPIRDDPTQIDLGETARQVALLEAGNGWQHGVLEIGVALLAAAMFVPLRSFLRSGSRDRR